MNHIFLGSKQVFLGTVRLGHLWLKEFGLTPARYNMMFAIAKTRGGVAQSELRTILGVSAPTIYRMLRSLEDLGYLVRRPHPRNAHRRWVSVTLAGAHRLFAAIRDLVTTQHVPWATEEIVSPAPGNHARGELAIADADTLFNRMRDSLNDIATLRFWYDGPYSAPREVRIPRAARCI